MANKAKSKTMTLKTYLNVDLTPGEDEVTKNNSKKRKESLEGYQAEAHRPGSKVMITKGHRKGESARIGEIHKDYSGNKTYILDTSSKTEPNIRLKSTHFKKHVAEATGKPSPNHPPVKVGDTFIHGNSDRVVTKVTPDAVHAKLKKGASSSSVHDHQYVQKQMAESVRSKLYYKTFSHKMGPTGDPSPKAIKSRVRSMSDKDLSSLTNKSAKLAKKSTPAQIQQRLISKEKSRRGVLEDFVDNDGSVELDEVISYGSRRKKARDLRKNKAKIKMGRKKASRRMADLPRLKNRSNKQARDTMFKKFSKGKARSEMSPAQRAQIEKRLSTMGSRIERIAKKILPAVRKQEIARKRGSKSTHTK
jgi:hypothetical protein